jgi:hypothetical protein
MNDLETQLKAHHTMNLAFHTGAARDHIDECEKAEHDCEGTCFHAKRATAHREVANYHSDCLKTLKADTDELAKGMNGPAVSAINPQPGKEVRPVFRTGQRDFSSDDVPPVDPNFAKIVSLD